MNTEHTSFSAGKSSSNKKLYLFLNLHTNQTNGRQEFIKLTASTRMKKQITLEESCFRKENEWKDQLGEIVRGLNSPIPLGSR